MSKHIPVRTCIGCFERRPQKELIRIGGGRGAYLCPNEECFEKAMKRKAFARVFRREVLKEEVSAFREEFNQKIRKSSAETSGCNRNGPC